MPSTPADARPKVVLELRLGDQLRLRKPHPCGSDRWEVVRLGADIGLRCLGCGRRVLLAREVLERRVRAITPAPPEAQ